MASEPSSGCEEEIREESTGARNVVRSLEELGVDSVFGLPGGAALPMYDAIFSSTRVRHILVRHEQGAGHAAEGYAVSTGRVGVCMATSGPGATNLVTSLLDALIPFRSLRSQVRLVRRSWAPMRSKRRISSARRCPL